MSSRKFRFVSPGVFLREIDNSQLPAQNEAVGPVIIGTANQGPAMVPTKIKSLEELEIVFGKTSPGGSLDPWREGTGLLSETHAVNAARAYLSAGAGTNSPVTMIRLLGVSADATADTDGEPGWMTDKAYGLFIANKNHNQGAVNSCEVQLAGIFYSSGSFAPYPFGDNASTGAPVTSVNASAHGQFYSLQDNGNLRMVLKTDASDPVPDRSRTVITPMKDLRKDLNTNPVATNSRISPMISGSLAERYWVGETFEQQYDKKKVDIEKGAQDKLVYTILPLASGDTNMSDFKSTDHGATAGRTGWVFGNSGNEEAATYNPDHQQKLFRLVALSEGQQASKEIIASIQDVVPPRQGSTNVFASFSVVVKKITSTKVIELERFSNCNLDPASANFIGKKIGTQLREWIPSEKRNRVYGEHPNMSSYIRVEMHESFPSDGPIVKSTVPFGFYGPIRPKTITGTTAVIPAAAGQGVLRVAATTDKELFGAAGSEKKFKVTDLGDGATTYTFTFDNNRNQQQAIDDSAGTDRFVGLDGAANTGPAISARIVSALNAARDDGMNIELVPASSVVDTKSVVTITQSNTGPVTTIENAAGADATPAAQIELAVTVAGNVASTNTNPAINSWAIGNLNFTNLLTGGENYTVKWPSPTLVEKAHSGRGNFLGISPYTQTFDKVGGIAIGDDKTAIEPGFIDNLRRLPVWEQIHSNQISGNVASDSTTAQYSFKFSMDDAVLTGAGGKTQDQIVSKGDVSQVTYSSGSRAGGTSFTAVAGNTPEDLRILFSIIDGFHLPFDGGSDGTDIIESDPFNNHKLAPNSTKTSYAYASVDRAIELIKDAEAIEHNLAVMPGITNRTLVRKLVDTCEARADSLAIVDLPNIYVPPSERHYSDFKSRLQTTPEESAKLLVQEQLNSSYGATYYPWVKVKDTSNGRDVWTPPSVVALGVMANTEKSSEVWFAPAGFNRGGLNQGNAGLPVLQVTEQLLSRDRDTLYQSNINPIASFVSEGIVIFGQKTLQSTQSALDRINVRRLLIFVKKEVSRISKNLLFEQNVQATWARFHGQIKPFLESVKVRFGLTDFKIVLDDTTTTPDLIDRNIMYAKIFLKPARSIEFIAVDFVITNTGASFADPLE
tara:strand:+ start:719 stop:4093 length:3375 start_codon:yes stop_codon:yes gene_type:complete